MGSPAPGEEETLLDSGHPILVTTSPSHRDLSVKLILYFGSRSKSGGGECDVIRVDGLTYCAIFHNQEDQRRVLRRGNHLIEITVSVTVHDIRGGDLATLRQAAVDGERRKVLQQLAASAENVKNLPNQVQVCLSSALYEYIMEVYRSDVEVIKRRNRVKIDHRSSPEGTTYVTITPLAPESLPEDAKETFTDMVQKVMGDWSQEKVDPSVVSLLKKEGYKPARPRGAPTISSGDIRTEVPVDVRHMDILKKLKSREISDIEKKYNVKMDERRKNGSVLVTFRSIDVTPDLSPHASHSFTALLQKTFFKIEKKEMSVNPEFQEERVAMLQEELLMRGVDIVMEYSGGSVLLIGHPVHVAFAMELFSGSQNPGRGQDY